MGLDYQYIADGNDVETLIKAFLQVKGIDHPIVLHIHTEKGKGYAPAEQNKDLALEYAFRHRDGQT